MALPILPAAVRAHADRSAVLRASGLSRRGAPGARTAFGTTKVTLARRGLRRLLALLEDLGATIVIVYAIPVGILAVGIPIALLFLLGMWIASVGF